MVDRADNSCIPTCYLCNEKGHKKGPDCTRRVRRIHTLWKNRHLAFVQRKVGQVECYSLLLDAGSECTVVHLRLVTEDLYL